MLIRPVASSDFEAIAGIYNHYIKTSAATFELEPIDVTEMSRRIDDLLRESHPFLVAEESGEILGYAYAHQFRPRHAYRRSMEVSVYVRPNREGQKIGTMLYERLIPDCFAAGAHTLIAVISLPNEASARLHEKFGFEKIGQFHEVGRKFDRWIDVGYWQLLAENDRS